jgi:hypothetical protein
MSFHCIFPSLAEISDTEKGLRTGLFLASVAGVLEDYADSNRGIVVRDAFELTPRDVGLIGYLVRSFRCGSGGFATQEQP